MNDNNIFSKFQLEKMNFDKRYGSQWIKNLEHINNKELIKIYATGDYTMSSGRIYIAFPANKILTKDDKLKYNIF